MKTNNFVRMVSLVLAIAFAGANGFADEGQNGNGGGGVNRNGRYMTFYSAGFYTETNEQTPDEVPQLNQLLQFFSSTNLMSEGKKAEFLKALMPSTDRHYYRVDSGKFTPEVRARLIAEYGRVMNINASEVALFGVTDTQSRTTYLFPEFFSLKPIEQQAILFHEAYWLVFPHATYKQVVDAEMAFQGFLEYPQSGQRILNWIEKTGSERDVLQAAIVSDLQMGAMNGFVDLKTKGPKFYKYGYSTIRPVPAGASVSLMKLFGEKFFECRANRGGLNCRAFIATHAYALTRQYPNSLFLKIYSRAASRETSDGLQLQYDGSDGVLRGYGGSSLNTGRLYLMTSEFNDGAQLTVMSPSTTGILQNIK